MNPAEAQEKLFPYVEGRTGPADTEAFETAMERDPALRRAVTNVRFLRDRLSRLRDRVKPDPALLDIAPPTPEKRPEKARQETEPAGGRERPIPTSLLAAGLVIVLGGVGLLVFLAGDGKPEPDGESATETVKREPGGARPAKTDVPLPPVAEPARIPDPERPARPTAVKPSVEMLIPRLLLEPSQARLEAVWAALAERPDRASAIYSRIPTAKNEGQRIETLHIPKISWLSSTKVQKQTQNVGWPHLDLNRLQPVRQPVPAS